MTVTGFPVPDSQVLTCSLAVADASQDVENFPYQNDKPFGLLPEQPGKPVLTFPIILELLSKRGEPEEPFSKVPFSHAPILQ